MSNFDNRFEMLHLLIESDQEEECNIVEHLIQTDGYIFVYNLYNILTADKDINVDLLDPNIDINDQLVYTVQIKEECHMAKFIDYINNLPAIEVEHLDNKKILIESGFNEGTICTLKMRFD